MWAGPCSWCSISFGHDITGHSFFLNQRKQFSGSGIHPGVLQGLHQYLNFGSFKNNTGCSFVPPTVVDGLEDGGVSLHIGNLLERRQLDHAMPGVGPAESGKDLAANPEIGVLHVLRFHRLRQAEGQAAELGCCHIHLIVYTILFVFVLLHFRWMRMIEDTFDGESRSQEEHPGKEPGGIDRSPFPLLNVIAQVPEIDEVSPDHYDAKDAKKRCQDAESAG